MKSFLLASLTLCILVSKTGLCWDHSATAPASTEHSTAPDPDLVLSGFPKCGLAQKKYRVVEGIQLTPVFIKSGSGPLRPSHKGDLEGECALLAIKDKQLMGAVKTSQLLNQTVSYTKLPSEMSGDLGNVFLLPSSKRDLPPEPMEAPCKIQDTKNQIAFVRPDGEPDTYFFGQESKPNNSEDPST